MMETNMLKNNNFSSIQRQLEDKLDLISVYLSQVYEINAADKNSGPAVTDDIVHIRKGADFLAHEIHKMDEKIGNISIAKKGDTKWSKLDESLLDEVASQVGLAVDNIRLLEEATQRATQEQTIGKLATRFSQSLDLDTLLQTAARELGQVPDVSEVSIFIGELSEDTLSKTISKRAIS